MARGEQYNGWTNYETWRVQLEIFDGQTLEDITGSRRRVTAYDLGDTCKEYVESLLEEQGKGIVLDYALAFVNNVDWIEIAKHLLEDSGVDDDGEEE